MIGRVVVHERRGSYYVESYDRNQKKVWLAGGSPIALPAGASAGVVGQAVMDALYQSQTETDRSGRSNLMGPMLELAGVKSYATFTKGLKTVSINADDESGDLLLRIRPTFKDSEGYASYEDNAVTNFAYDSPGQVGQAVLEALAVATAT